MSCRRRLLLPFLLLLLQPHHITSASPTLTDHFIRTSSSSSSSFSPQEYLDPTNRPLPLPPTSPSCSLLLLRHSFANTYSSPPATAPYSPPPSCPSPWSRIILFFSASSHGDQYDRIAAVWLDAVELLRTSTAEPTLSGVHWIVQKDITRFSSLLRRLRTLSVMLENIVNEVYTGVYHVNVSIQFYPLSGDSNKGQYPPADLILPISRDSPDAGHWFTVNSAADIHSKTVVVPANAHRAVLEIFVSFHGNDEFWYSNPPDSYITTNNLTTQRGGGAFREVFATIDSRFSGSVTPFPVIFTGGINPLFWEPVVAIGAFDLPSYNLDLTPFLGLLIDGKPHEIGLGVVDAISYWLLDASLHLWLDPHSDSVHAKMVDYIAPNATVSRTSRTNHLNGTFGIEAGRELHISGWVASSFGNFTTEINQKSEFESLVEFLADGNYKEVHTKAKNNVEVITKTGSEDVVVRVAQRTEYPLLFVTSTAAGESGTYTSVTKLSHSLYAETSSYFDGVTSTSVVADRQEAVGEMLVQDHSVLSGSASTEQSYGYQDEDGCYLRKVGAKDGDLLYDESSNVCGLDTL